MNDAVTNIEAILLVAILGAPLAAALLVILLRRLRARVAGWIAGLGAAFSLACTFALLPALWRDSIPSVGLQWIPSAGISLRLHLDWLTLPFLVTEAAVTLLAVIYAWGYHHPDDRTPFFYALLMLFAVGMSGTTLADSMFLFYIFWELMLVASCALIIVWGDGESRGAVAFKYFVFTHLGSLMVLVGLIILYDATGNDSFSRLRQGVILAPAVMTSVTALFVTGFCVKMAIFPLHLWLPDAHTVAPMSVTIMLAAAMLSMGTYGILRFPMSIFSPAQMIPFAVPMMIAGIVSELYGALMALAEQDVKRIIAYSSVSQMGYILFGLGTLTYEGVAGATLHVIYHAIVKALLFMCIGLVVRATGRRRISELGGLGRPMPIAAVCTSIGALAMAGTPPFCIFDSEWMIFAGGFKTEHTWLAVLSLFGSLLTVAYALWFAGRIFFGPAKPPGLEKRIERTLPWQMIAPTILLAALALIEGIFPAPLFNWVAHELSLILGGGL
ncbi:MAG: NADH-quinone oxidoreductase subunit M [Anaerolineae bacterium]|nr:NADH-quinone oxidoreductase subunit M [Anaerolineae bacterium]